MVGRLSTILVLRLTTRQLGRLPKVVMVGLTVLPNVPWHRALHRSGAPAPPIKVTYCHSYMEPLTQLKCQERLLLVFQMQGKPFGGRGFTADPLDELTALPGDRLAGGKGTDLLMMSKLSTCHKAVQGSYYSAFENHGETPIRQQNPASEGRQ